MDTQVPALEHPTTAGIKQDRSIVCRQNLVHPWRKIDGGAARLARPGSPVAVEESVRIVVAPNRSAPAVHHDDADRANMGFRGIRRDHLRGGCCYVNRDEDLATLVMGVVGAITFTPGGAAAQDCLSYLADDVEFDNVHTVALAVSTTIRAAIEAQDAAATRAIETRDAGKWKDYVEARRQTEQPFAASTAATDERQRRTEVLLEALRARRAALSRDGFASAAYDAADRVADAARAESDAANRAAVAAHATWTTATDAADDAYLDVWLPAARVQLMDAYVEALDINIVFTADAHERQTACPAVGNPELLEPLEILGRY